MNGFLIKIAAADTSPVNITSVADVENSFTRIVNVGIVVFWMFATAVIIWSAYTFLTAGDNAEKVEKAKKILIYAVIAAAVALLATGVQPIVTNILLGK